MPGPGSIYFLIKGLRDEAFIIELPGSEKGTMRRYVIANKGKSELAKLKESVRKETKKQLDILAYYCALAGDGATSKAMKELSSKM